MNIKLILAAVIVTAVTFGLQAVAYTDGRAVIAQRAATANPAPLRQTTVQSKQAAIAPRTSTVTQQKAAMANKSLPQRTTFFK